MMLRPLLFNVFLFMLLVAIETVTPDALSSYAVIYPKSNYGGTGARVPVTNCLSPLSPIFHNEIASINTEGNCVHLYKEKGCIGDYLVVKPGTLAHEDLDLWISNTGGPYFANGVGSIGPCEDECSSHFQTLRKNSTTVVNIFHDRRVESFKQGNAFRNSHTPVTVQGCVPIKRPDLSPYAAAIEFIDSRACIELYEDRNCTKSLTRRYKFTPRLHLHTDPRWDSTTFKSISLCGFNCPPETNAPNTSSNQTLIMIILGILVFCLVVGVLILTRVLMRRRRNHQNHLTNEKIKKAMENEEKMEISNLKHDKSLLTPGQALNQNYEMSKSDFEIDVESLLGNGAFASVYKGEITRPVFGFNGPVAIKVVQHGLGPEYRTSTLKEIKTMISVRDNSRMLKIIGCCTAETRTGELYIMTELCTNGSLESFLRRNAGGFINLIRQEPNNGLHADNQWYMTSPDLHPFDTMDLLTWSTSIAEGMNYLTSKKIIHGDLAARNILLDANLQIRISDFGLSKQLYQYSIYIKDKRKTTPLPWPYMAIETLRTFTFSTESDVWAFGVTLYEIFTLGLVPFAEKTWNEQFLCDLVKGVRLPKPKYATSEWYELMLQCWKIAPGDRISFSELHEEFAKAIDTFTC